MKITQEEVVDRQTVLQIELEDEDLDTYLDQGYRRVVQRTMIPGFRKGKAPRRLVENFLGRDSLLNEVLDSMLPEVTSRAIAQQELEAGGLPEIELQEMDPFTFKATVPLTPEVDLGPYEDIRIAEEPWEVTEEDVLARIEQLRHNLGSWEPVERPVKLGDMVTMAATGNVGGSTILDQEDAVYFLDGDGNRPFPGFAQHLVDITSGEPKEFTLAIPEDFSDEEIAGKEAHFSVTVNEIKERVLPDVDDEFAKSVGDGYESLDALRQEVEKNLETEAEQGAAERHKQAVVDAILEGATVALPELIVEHEVEHMVERQGAFLGRADIRVDDYLRSIGKTEEEVRAEMRDEAVDRLNRSAALSEVAKREDLEVSAEELEERVQTMVSESGEQEDRLQDSDELRDSVRRVLMAGKTMDRLVAIARGEASVSAEDSATEGQQGESGDQGADTDDKQA